MTHDLAKTTSFLALHLLVGFTVAFAVTGSVAMAGGIALIEPCVNAVVFFFHERAWRGELSLAMLLPHRHGAAAA
ncbi:DUF2061 domain-containing protein [Novosphingobium album (ex Liu et al. 2023)]|uniref:DUF2061 domain-containing protein n=1 Tax=Novosphingobium album (ex Liu et al. 2023) TaxID=3031130 RepID=A0ABT5WLT7_9SPHN|nr:DUF2061 domain-containing protein [Novosphingobium album (ex Liu et al. 2023)]MDE8650262.1 DUF2061 domain-containing protein [Novosphingobium album (ex Liu et al. 2023)]